MTILPALLLSYGKWGYSELGGEEGEGETGPWGTLSEEKALITPTFFGGETGLQLSISSGCGGLSGLKEDVGLPLEMGCWS